MTKRIPLVLAMLCVVVASLTTAAQSSPQTSRILAPAEHVANLGTLKLQLQSYYACTCTCGCYAKELDHQAQLAIDFLARRVARRGHEEKLAMVLDIDETALSNYKEMADADYGYNSKAFDAWEDSSQASAIPGTLRLYREAQRLGVSVFFITGRSEAHRAATEENLKSQGYASWQGLILRSSTQSAETTIGYKSGARQTIVNAGYRIILNVGDQYSDLKGTPGAEVSVKLPNPFYYIP